MITFIEHTNNLTWQRTWNLIINNFRKLSNEQTTDRTEQLLNPDIFKQSNICSLMLVYNIL